MCLCLDKLGRSLIVICDDDIYMKKSLKGDGASCFYPCNNAMHKQQIEFLFNGRDPKKKVIDDFKPDLLNALTAVSVANEIEVFQYLTSSLKMT